MALSLDDIHELEIRQEYPAAIDALEELVRSDPSDAEAVIRLGFNLWYVVAEAERLQASLPTQHYASRFMELFRQHRDALADNPDFCWAFGQGMNMFWWAFPGATEQLGKSLIDTACRLDGFWSRFWTDLTEAEGAGRLRGRGILQRYYNVR